jgi:hypothetical protein
VKQSDMQWIAARQASDFSAWIPAYKQQIQLTKRAAAAVRTKAWTFFISNTLNSIGIGLFTLGLGVTENGLRWALKFVLLGAAQAVVFVSVFLALRLHKTIADNSALRVLAMALLLFMASDSTHHVCKFLGDTSGIGWWGATSTNALFSLAAIGLLIRRRRKAFEREIASGHYISIARNQIPALWNILDELIERADFQQLGRPPITAWLTLL